VRVTRLRVEAALRNDVAVVRRKDVEGEVSAIFAVLEAAATVTAARLLTLPFVLVVTLSAWTSTTPTILVGKPTPVEPVRKGLFLSVSKGLSGSFVRVYL
jgi:hypothetical protein